MGDNREYSKNRNMGRRGPGGHGGMMPGEKAKEFKGTTRKILSYIGSYKIAIVLVMISAVAGTVFNIVGPKVLSKATTEIFNGLVSKVSGGAGIDFHKVGVILLILLGLYCVSALFSFIQGYIMSGISQKLSFRMRKEISEKINRMPLAYFESKTVGEVLSRITNDVDTFGMSLNQSITTLITSVTTLIGVFIMMMTISPLMTLIALVILPISAFLISVVVKHSQKYFKAQQEYLGDINGTIEESYSGHMQPIMTFVGNLGYVAVAVTGSMLAVAGSITVGDIQAFIQYVRSFTQPITQIAQVFNMLQSMAAAAERIFEFLDEEEEPVTENPVRLEDIKGEVEFEHVRFGYDPQKPVIHDFTCHVEPGSMVAIVGPTGAGKTTMVKLLMRFYDVNSGCIKVDGENVKDFERRNLREAFGMVLQDTWLFKGTIMENIRYGRLDATDEEVIAAAKAANADHFIRTLPGGYAMELNEEASNVSQGQKQLLTIARAILADNRIMILDEATSSVDTRTEQHIQDAMANLMKGRTSFVIAHRLSTIRDADVIFVMKDGDIIEQGNHKQLLAQNGFYAQLYNSQFEG